MRGNVVESGLLEIYRFLPPALLEDFDIEEIGLDEFLRYVAKARYIQELEERIVAQAAPAQPMWKLRMKTRSSTTFSAEERIRK